MSKNNDGFKLVLAGELSLIVDGEIILEAVIISDDTAYCYPCFNDYELYMELNEVLEKLYRNKPYEEPYIVVYDVVSGGSIVGFKLPTNSNMFLRLKYAKHSDIAKKKMTEIVNKLIKHHNEFGLKIDINDYEVDYNGA